MAKARKSWDEYTPDYRKRLERHGITKQNYRDPSASAKRQTARSHAKTPEHPERAKRNPERYKEYLSLRADETRQVIARKDRLFGDRVKFNSKHSEKYVMINPKTEKPPDINYMRRFLRMTDEEIESIDWRDDEWSFIYYH
jgi:hypothetical protein